MTTAENGFVRIWNRLRLWRDDLLSQVATDVHVKTKKVMHEERSKVAALKPRPSARSVEISLRILVTALNFTFMAWPLSHDDSPPRTYFFPLQDAMLRSSNHQVASSREHRPGIIHQIINSKSLDLRFWAVGVMRIYNFRRFGSRVGKPCVRHVTA